MYNHIMQFMVNVLQVFFLLFGIENKPQRAGQLANHAHCPLIEAL
jgi:hypothetical protein